MIFDAKNVLIMTGLSEEDVQACSRCRIAKVSPLKASCDVIRVMHVSVCQPACHIEFSPLDSVFAVRTHELTA